MKLRDLTITQLPGFGERLQVEGFDPGFTLVTGPNASGKSSLVRALRHLVAADAGNRNGALTLEARFQAGDDTLTVARSGEQIIWQRNGQPMDAPELPAGDYLRCYWLSMNDLLQAGDTETTIVERLQRELAGGFDLASVRGDPLFEVKARQGQNEAKKLREREYELRQRQRDYADLDQKRHRLAELEQLIQAARAARTDHSRTEQALAWLSVRQSRLEAEQQCAQFPQAVKQLQGHELERLEELEAQRAKLQEQVRDARRQQEDERRKRDGANLGGAIPESAELDACRAHLEEADRLASDIDSIRERLEDARVRESNAAAALNPPEGRQPEATPQAVNEAGEVAESLRRSQLRLEELEARLERIEAVQGSPDDLRAQITELRRWLRQLEPARRRGLLVGSAVALVAAGVAAFVGLLYGLPLSWVPALVALGASGWSAQQCVSLINTARQAQQRAEEVGVRIEVWEPEAVTQHLTELEAELGQLEHQQALAQKAKPLQEEIEKLHSEQSQLEGNKQALAEAVGFDPTLIGESAARFLKLAADLDEARRERSQLQQRLDSLEASRDSELQPVRDLLQRHGMSPGDTSVKGLRAAFNDLQQRAGTVREAQGSLDRLQSQLERLEADERQQREAISALYRKLGLPEGDRSQLELLLGQLEAWREATATLEAEYRSERNQKAGLEEHSELVTLVEAGDRPGLDERLERLQEQASYYDHLVEERSALATQLDQAGQDRALEKVRFERDRARDELENVYDAAMLAEAGQFLLAEVDEAHRSEREPAVLADARETFARFTHHRYALRMDQSGKLRVRDQVQEQDRNLSELSTGTHMQLLMALRLAWVREQEQGSEPLPIFLDEVLTTSDPERFRAIAASLQVLVEEGRQMVYLSAEPADRPRWEEAMGRTIAHIDLQALRQGTGVPEPEAYRLSDRETLPSPEGIEPEVWASRIAVPPVRPIQGAGGINVFHILRDDLPFAHHLMQDWRVDTLGRLETLLQQPAATLAVPDARRQQELSARCRIARVWVDVWRRGRGHPVDRNVLEASGAVSAKFIDGVSELADRVGNDARALLEELANGGVPRFQRSKQQELEAYLENNGYLDSEQPLDAEERERAVLMEAGHEAEAAVIRQWIHWLEDAGVSAQ